MSILDISLGPNGHDDQNITRDDPESYTVEHKCITRKISFDSSQDNAGIFSSNFAWSTRVYVLYHGAYFTGLATPFDKGGVIDGMPVEVVMVKT